MEKEERPWMSQHGKAVEDVSVFLNGPSFVTQLLLCQLLWEVSCSYQQQNFIWANK